MRSHLTAHLSLAAYFCPLSWSGSHASRQSASLDGQPPEGSSLCVRGLLARHMSSLKPGSPDSSSVGCCSQPLQPTHLPSSNHSRDHRIVLVGRDLYMSSSPTPQHWTGSYTTRFFSCGSLLSSNYALSKLSASCKSFSPSELCFIGL